MARANRHFISEYAWHLTHRCHKREFLLKFAKDKQRWMYWLFEAKKRLGLLLLKGAISAPVEVYISLKNLYDIKNDIEYFIKDSNEPSLKLWVVSNWKFGVILPGAVLLFCLIVFSMGSWSIIRGKPLR
jgi:hypothetical protein